MRNLALVTLAAFAAGCGGGSKTKGPVPAPLPVAPGPKVAPPELPPAPGGGAPPPALDGRLPGGVTPTRYRIALTIDPEKARFQGKTTIAVDLAAPTRAIVLHARKMLVTSASVSGVPARPALRMAVGGKEDPEELVLELGKELPAGGAEITVEYDAPFDDQLRGLYRVKDGEHWYAFTQFEPTDARRAFPCFDEPGWKVPFEISITTPKGNIALANTDQASEQDGVFQFKPTLPLPTYLIAFGVGPFEFLTDSSADKPAIRVVTTTGKSQMGKQAQAAAHAFVKYMEDYFAVAYPYDKLDLVAVPEFAAGAMENPGFITFRDEILLLDDAASMGARRRMAGTLAHELAHQWFGDLVTMKWWNDLWLNEGFATWMGAKAVDAWRSDFGARVDALSDKAWVMETDALDSARAVRQPVKSTSEALEAFDGITYVKGAAILFMLEGYVGEQVFRDGIRAYIQGHANGSATADDLMAELDKVGGEKPVSKMAASYLDRAGLPVVRVSEPVCQGAAVSVELSQRRYQRAGAAAAADQTPWVIPVCLLYGTAKGKSATACRLLVEERASVALPGAPCKNGWVYPNASETGYYRWAVPDAMFTRLADAASKGALPVAQRLGLLNDMWALVGSGDLGADVMLGTLARFGGERDRHVVEALDSSLRTVWDTLIGPEHEAAYSAYVNKLLAPLAKQLGWDRKKSDDEDRRLMRQTVLRLLGDVGRDKATLAEASKRTKAWIAKPGSLDPDIASLSLAMGARSGDRATLDGLKAIYKSAKTPEERIIAATGMGNLSDPALVTEVFDMPLGTEARLQDFRYFLRPSADRREMRPVLYQWIKQRWDIIKAKMGGFGIGRLVGFTGYLCTQPEREAAAAFFGPAIKDLEAVQRSFQEGLEQADVCIATRAREAARVATYFKR